MKAVVRKYGQELWRMALSLAVFLVAVFTGGDTERIAPFAVVLILLISAGLLVFKSIQYLNLPFLLLTLLLIFCYDSFSVFVGYIWLLPIVLLSLVVYLWRVRPRFVRGMTFWPLVAVSAATFLGGVGMISAADYFRPVSLGFMVGLGPALIFSYWIMRHELEGALARSHFLRDLCYWGGTAAAIVFWYVLPLIIDHGALFGFKVPQWSNNVSTMLMIALPASLAWKNRRVWHYFLLALMFAATMLVGSRGGQLFVGVEVVLCCLWAWRTETDYVKRLWNRTFFVYSLMISGYILSLIIYNGLAAHMITQTESRALLLRRSVEDFFKNPLFGSGIGYRGNADLYNGKTGTIHWYHMLLPQIVGGLGLCGIAAWGYQLYNRVKLSVRALKTTDFGFALSYVGLFLMSQVNPGEFCPVPYAFLAVCAFAALEGSVGETNKKVLQATA